MPSVPRVTGPSVSPEALPGVRQQNNASPGALGGIAAAQVSQFGAGLANVGQVTQAIATDLQERENAAMVFSAETTLKDDYLAYETEAKKRKGQAAWGLTDETEKWFADQKREHTKVLTNDRQRMLFDQQLTRLRQSAMGSISNYEAGERDRAVAESAQASIVSSINLGAAAASDGADVMSASSPVNGLKKDVLTRIDVLAQMNGWTPEKRELEANRYVTVLHKQVLGALVDRDPATANAYYAANKAEIDGTERVGIESLLKKGTIRQQAQDATEAVMGMGLSEKEALKYVRKEFDDEVQDEIEQRVKSRYAEFDQLREQGQRQAADQAWRLYANNQRLEDVPTTVLNAMDGRDVETLRAHAKQLTSGTTVKTDPETYYGLRSMLAQDPAKFMATDLRRYINQLSGEDFQEFVKLQTNQASQQEAATLTQQLSNTHDLLGLSSDDREKKGQFDKAVTDAVNAEQKRLGKPLNYDERQVIIDRMTIQGDVTRGFFNDSEGMFYEAVAGSDAAGFTPEISDADRALIVDKFKNKYKRDPSDEEIMQTFKVWKGLY